MPRSKTLLGKTADAENLEKAWHDISRLAWDSSHGFSDETIQSFRSNQKENLKFIQKQLLTGDYEFGLLRATTRQKKGSNKRRPLKIADIQDRVVQRAITRIIETPLTRKFHLNNKASFAYVRKKGVRAAIREMLEYHQRGYNVVLKADIENFFDTVNVDDLLNNLIFPHLDDHTLDLLIKKTFEMQIGNRESLSEQDKKLFPLGNMGLPQGGYLSPIFSNIYLSGFDHVMIDKKFKLIRYADDFIVMCKTIDQAKDAYLLAKEVLEQELKLKLHEMDDSNKNAKTKILELGKQKIRFLGIQFDGKRIVPDPEKKLELSRDLGAIRNEAKTVMELLTKTRNLLQGWIASYSFTDLTESYLNSIDREVDKIIWSTLGSLEWRLKTRLRLSEIQRLNSGIEPVAWHLDKVRRRYPTLETDILEKYWTQKTQKSSN
jgi:RNA-directed DNA polymerase